MLKTTKKGRLKPLRILLADDHAMLLDALRRQFDADPAFRVVAIAESLSQVREAVKTHCPDAVLLDIQMGSESGLDAIACIRLNLPAARIIMLSMFDQAIYRDRAFELGADAYVTKGASFADLRALLIDNALPASSEGPVRIWRNPGKPQAARLALTARELQVVQILASGKREKEVADELNISPSSVGTYLKRAMQKAGIETRAELFRCAGALGIHTAGEVGE